MGNPRFEVLSGVVDGTNTVFTSSAAYASGTSAVFLNGQLKVPTFQDGWAETDPATGTVTLDEAPRVGDVVQMFYLDTSDTVVIVTGPEPITGTLCDVTSLDGRLDATPVVCGTICGVVSLVGALNSPTMLSGMIDSPTNLTGTLEAVQ